MCTNIKVGIFKNAIPKENIVKLDNVIKELHQLALGMSKIVVSYTFQEMQDKPFVEYNAIMYSKFCILIDGIRTLAKTGNYYGAQILNRSLLEIYATVHFLSSKQNRLQDYRDLNNKKIPDKAKVRALRQEFSYKNMLEKTHRKELADQLYEGYQQLCDAVHPSKEPALLYGISEVKAYNKKILMANINFGPEPSDEFARFNILAYSLGTIIHMLEFENELFRLKNAEYNRIKQVILKNAKIYNLEIWGYCQKNAYKQSKTDEMRTAAKKKRLVELASEK